MFYCGIDVGKNKHAVVVLDEHGHVQKTVFVIENTHAGLDFLLEQLKPFGEDVQIGLEATGHYWLSLYDVLTRNGYPVTVINPLQSGAVWVNTGGTLWVNIPGAFRAIIDII